MIQAIGLTSTSRRQRLPRVDDLTFEARPGKVTVLLGPAGSGKSEALRLMLQLLPGRGVALFRGRSVHRIAHPAREIGVLLGDVPGHPARTARGHLRMLTAVAGVPVERADDVLDVVGLSGLAGQKLGDFSLGMDRRLGIAAALLGDPHTLVLDEPTRGLSPREASWLYGLLREYADQGGLVLASSRDPREAARIADRVVSIDGGRLVADQDAADFSRTRLRPRVAVRTPHAERFAAVLTQEARSAERGGRGTGVVEVVCDGGGRVSVYGSDCASVGESAYRHGILVHRIAEEIGDAGDKGRPEPLVRADGRAPRKKTSRLSAAPSATAPTAPDEETAPVPVGATAASAHGAGHAAAGTGTDAGTPLGHASVPGPAVYGASGEGDQEPQRQRQSQDQDQDSNSEREREQTRSPEGAEAQGPQEAEGHIQPHGPSQALDQGQGQNQGPDQRPVRDHGPRQEAEQGGGEAIVLTPLRSTYTPVPSATPDTTVAPAPAVTSSTPTSASAPQATLLPPLPSVRRPGPVAPVRYEVRRLFGVRTPWVVMVVALLVAFGVAAMQARSGAVAAEASAAGLAPVLRLLMAWPAMPFLLPPVAVAAGLLGALAFGQEFRYPALAPAQAPVPRRLGLLLAKLLVTAGAAIGLCLFSALLNVGALTLLYGTESGALTFPAHAFELSSFTGLSTSAGDGAGNGSEAGVGALAPSFGMQVLAALAVCVGCGWAGLLAAGVFRSSVAGVAAVAAVPLLVAPLARKLLSGPAVQSLDGLPERLRAAVLFPWPSGAEQWVTVAMRIASQPVGRALALSLTVLLCAYVLTSLRSKPR